MAVCFCIGFVLFVVAVGGPLIVASIDLYPNYSVDEAKRDFDYLNKWLIKHVPDIDDPSVNLLFAEQKLEKLHRSSWSVRRSERALIKPIEMLNRLSEVQECDDQTLELIRYIHLSSHNGKDGLRRVDKLFNYYGKLAADKCEPYLDGRFIDLVENCVHKDQVERLFELVKPNTMHLWQGIESSSPLAKEKKSSFEYQLAMKNTNIHFGPRDLFNTMKELAKDDPRGVFVEWRPNELTGNMDRIIHKNNARYVYDTYLVAPCKHYKFEMEQFNDAFYAIKDYQDLTDRHNTKFVSRHPDFVQLGLFRYQVCERILSTQSSLGDIYHLIAGS